MTEGLRYVSFFLLGIWSAWAAGILREDLKIRKQVSARRIRAVLLAVLTSAFLAVTFLTRPVFLAVFFCGVLFYFAVIKQSGARR